MNAYRLAGSALMAAITLPVILWGLNTAASIFGSLGSTLSVLP